MLSLYCLYFVKIEKELTNETVSYIYREFTNYKDEIGT